MTGGTPTQGAPHRILALLELVDEAPTTEELAEFLTDTDPDVRRTALTVLSEAAESWEEPSAVFAAALLDRDPTVRRVAIELLGELREVLVSGERFSRSLREACGHPDADVRSAAVVALWRHRLCTVDELTALLTDPDEAVRCETVLGLVSLDALDALAKAAGDPAAAVRLAVARGLAAVGDPRGAATLIRLAEDSDLLVRAAALSAMAHTGCTEQAADLARTALADPAWQVRQGAAAALAVADPQQAVTPLITATKDTNLDVRKAAVRALGGLTAGRPEVRAALEAAVDDVDADVRAFARMGLSDARTDLTESPSTDTATS